MYYNQLLIIWFHWNIICHIHARKFDEIMNYGCLKARNFWWQNNLNFWVVLTCCQNIQKLSFSKIQNELKFCIMFNPFSATLCKVLSRFVGNCTRWRMVEQKMSLSSTSYVCFRDVDEKGHWPQFSWGWEMVQGVQASFSKFPKLISMLPNFYEL